MQRKYRGQRKFSVREIKEALQQNYGNCYMAANALNEAERQRGGTRTIDRRTVAYHVRTRPELNAVADEGREEICDIAEQTIFKAIRDGNTALAVRYLETQGKRRGYSRRDEVALALLKLDPSKQRDEDALALLKLDPSKLSPEQTIALFDPRKLTEKQIDAVLDNLAARGLLAEPRELSADDDAR
jgi:hypothetical protein